jgi:hypothetical protein
MKARLGILILGLSIFFNRGLMAEHSSFNWVAMQDEETGLRAEFPHYPVEMNIELPFQNTPPTGQLRLYSTPMEKGLLALSTFFSPAFNAEGLQKEQLQTFFETVLVPHFFFNPAVFQQHQTYRFRTLEIEGQEAASFQFSFKDHKVLKRLEGMAYIQDQTLYVAFYMASDSDFDQEVFKYFLNSVQFPAER